MKKIMRILLGTIVILGLSACANKPNDKESAKDNPTAAEKDSGEVTEQNTEEEIEEQPEEEVTTKDILVEIKDSLATEFAVELPTNFKVSKGKHLSATATSDSGKYEVEFYETDEPVELNDEKLKELTPIAIIKGSEYPSSEEANEQIGYQMIQDGMPEINLGHEITGYQDAGAGSSFITWHEGRWSMIVSARNDETGNEAGLDLSKAIVEKLEGQALPVPHENGAGTFSSVDNDKVDTNRIAWQEEKVVYEAFMADSLALVDFVTEGFGK